MGWLRLASVLACAVVTVQRTGAFPDGAPWESAEAQGCGQCHFDAPVVRRSPAVAIEGLPLELAPGERYTLAVRLSAQEMLTAGFLLSVWQGEREAAGRFSADSERVTTKGAQARSTEIGAALKAPAMAEWIVDWVAPRAPIGPIRFELWANAANDDQSPFGDSTHHRIWQVPIPISR